MSENLSGRGNSPLFYYMIAGVPGMMAYKMINTMDSMLGYRNERYELFGNFAARLDDVANFLPARLTALMMVVVTGSRRGLRFIRAFGHLHKSPNAGYPGRAGRHSGLPFRRSECLSREIGGKALYRGAGQAHRPGRDRAGLSASIKGFVC